MCDQKIDQIDIVADLKKSGAMKKLPATAHKTVLLYLGYCARRDPASKEYRQCWPSQQDISEGTGHAVRTVRDATKDLEAWGLISRELIKSKNGHSYYLYTIADYDVLTRIGGGNALKRDKKAPAATQMPLFSDPNPVSDRITSAGGVPDHVCRGGYRITVAGGVPDHQIRLREVEVKEGRKEGFILKIKDPSFLPSDYRSPDEIEKEISYRMLVDDDICLGSDVAREIANIFDSQHVFNVLTQYVDDRICGSVRGPGVLLSRFGDRAMFKAKTAAYSSHMCSGTYDFFYRYSDEVESLYADAMEEASL